MHKWLADFSKPIYKRIKICCKSMYSKNNWKNNFFVRASSLINFRKFTIFSTFHNSILINKPCVYSIVLPFVPSPQQLYYNNKYNKMYSTRSWIFFLMFWFSFFRLFIESFIRVYLYIHSTSTEIAGYTRKMKWYFDFVIKLSEIDNWFLLFPTEK